MKNYRVKRMTGISILAAVTIVLALISNNVTIATVNINLALIPIVVGACIYGPTAGLLLGIIDGALICVAPSTLAFFMPHNPLMTIVLCLLKTGIGGLLSGVFYNLFKNKNELLAVFFASLILPIVNTTIFIIGVVLFFMPIYGNFINLIKGVLTINFLIEFIINLILSPTVFRIIKAKSVYR